jgi:molybdopterin-guanine dinucleotide biosynthesis protein A
MNRGVSGLVLAGGQGRRMGGIDKGLAPFRGRPMIAAVIERLRPQVDAIAVNANRNLDRYAGFDAAVLPDAIGGYAGPLAGLHAGLAHARSTLLVTVPCDSPFLPADLVARLAAGRSAADADVAVARTGAQPHPVFALVRTAVADHLGAFLAAGGRKIDAWYASLRVVEVDFADEAAFANINTPEDLARLGLDAPGPIRDGAGAQEDSP